uniref:Uncharacterized protein n=1 Tax=Anguilla anguilla TaxID=7936 RepID=A0A0E9RW09_ANGAN
MGGSTSRHRLFHCTSVKGLLAVETVQCLPQGASLVGCAAAAFAFEKAVTQGQRSYEAGSVTACLLCKEVQQRCVCVCVCIN